MKTVYCLKDPRTLQVRYVGRTGMRLRARLLRHVYSSRVRNGRKDRWIRSLNGLEPIIEVLERVSEDEASGCEKKWIDHFSSEPLTNLNGMSRNNRHLVWARIPQRTYDLLCERMRRTGAKSVSQAVRQMIVDSLS